ncbi:MAG: hypothetical protein H6Q68_3379 [Firmicutes bacterium]|nr:hypothetical protein [Bacillota bacterium]
MSGVIILNCRVCGAGVEADEQQCSKCREMENKVQVLTLEERQYFNGITLEQDQPEEGRHYEYQDSNVKQQMYSRQFNISSTGFLTKLLLGVILAGLVFIALPIAIFFISIVSIILYLVRR